jgi:regulator of protease activity HflC (stomatin/prohibitin superfamily)
MLAIKYLLMVAGVLLLAAGAAIAIWDSWRIVQQKRWLTRRTGKDVAPEMIEPLDSPQPVRWRISLALGVVACLPLLIAMSIVVVPSGMGGVAISDTRGTLPGTLYSGVHFIAPLGEHVQTFDLRDQIFASVMPGEAKPTTATTAKGQVPVTESMMVQSKEGLTMGLAIAVRYRLDPRRLDYVQSHLPQPIEKELVPPIVDSAWRELAPSYTVREIFSSKREEVRRLAAETITKKLGEDGILVSEVMLRDIQLPPEYAKGLEVLLEKEQKDDQMTVETEMQRKQVTIAELEAEAEKVQKVKQAEADAQSKVVEAKGEADAMQYTLPLKEKQIEQSRLEAEARKESTIKNAEAQGEAKVIDSKAELQRRNMLADAEANRIKVVAVADAERERREADVLKQSPLMINKIIAERLSDKIQVMMVPSDGKFFFANDVFRGFNASPAMQQELQGDDNGRAGAPAGGGH